MPRMILALRGVDVREIMIPEGRTTVGRKPSNDLVIDNAAVSGRHAALHRTADVVMLEDLGSTNGTHVNGQAIRMQVLRDADRVQLGQYILRFVAETAQARPPGSHLRVLSGQGAGGTLALCKVVTTVGKPGLAVAAVTHRLGHYLLTPVDAGTVLNGRPLGADAAPLDDGDVVEVAGLRLQFVA